MQFVFIHEYYVNTLFELMLEKGTFKTYSSHLAQAVVCNYL